jgi:hypothetical protein
MLFIVVYLSFEFQFGSRVSFGSVQADQSIDLPFPVWLHDATTNKMLASGITMQLDFLAIRDEELCDANPSKPTCGWKTH